MEIKLDVGKNILSLLEKESTTSQLPIDEFATNMIELGLRIHIASLKEKNQKQDESLKYIIENNRFIKEIMRCVFDRNKIKDKLFDSDTLISMIENGAEEYFNGKLDS